MIDIIIPVYNAGKHIARTLNSVSEQVNAKDLCVYIIDDCSTDDYQDIINYFSKYINIIYIRLKKNGGPGIARNAGIENSKNEYIVFLDSDDEFFSTDSVLKLYDAIVDHDLVFGKMKQITNNNSFIAHHEGCLHGKMYRRSFLNQKKIRFNHLKSHEDNAFNQLCLSCTDKVNYIDDVVYIYNDVDNSITKTTNNIDSFKYYIESMNWFCREVERQKYVNNYYAGVAITCMMLYCYFNYLLDEKEFNYCFDEMSPMKAFYEKYNKYLDYSDMLRIYKNFDYPVIPQLTLFQFIDKIK